MDSNLGRRSQGSRCVALVGPYLSGKTTLLEAILFRTGATRRQGKISEKSTIGDASPEARGHGMSVELNVATTDYLFNGGDSIPALKKGRRPFTTGVSMRQMLLDACGDLAKAGKPLVAPALGRYNIAPELYKAAREHKLAQ